MGGSSQPFADRVWAADKMSGFRIRQFADLARRQRPRDRMHAEVRMARIVEAVGFYKTGNVAREQAAEWFEVSERHFRRLRDRYETK
jgi:hypothetical protein